LQEGDAELLAAYDRFLLSREVILNPVSREAWDLAAEVRAKHGLKTPDVAHIACAVTGGCGVLLMADRRLAGCPDIRAELVGV
jgi:predicted nucleic acid-binding protein